MRADGELVQASLSGDLKAFAALIDRYQYAVYGLCLSYMRNRDTAEDTAQEAFIKAFLKLRDLTDPHRFAPWLKQIAANECRMWQRRRRDHLPLGETPVEELAVQNPSTDEELIARETRQNVLLALGKLNQVQQQIVTLYYLESLPLEQIAIFLDIPFQTANQRLYRARNRLKEEMLNMVEETLGQQKLPENFTAEVIEVALQRGRQLLEEKNWTEARMEFRKITASVDDHLEAHRGLALALDGEVNDMLEDTDRPKDEKLLHEAVVAHEEAYRLGAREEETVMTLASFYWDLNRHEDRARLLESHAEETDDPGRSFRAFVKAAWSARKAGDDERALALHRRAVAIEGIPPQERFDGYSALPIAIYCETGNADTWLAETEILYPQFGSPLSGTHYMYFRDRMSILRHLERYDEALQTGQHYLDLLDSEGTDGPVQRRWWKSDTLGGCLRIQTITGDEEGLKATLEAAVDNIQAYQSEWDSAVADEADDQRREELDAAYRRFVGYAVHNMGAACGRVGYFDEAITLLERVLKIRATGPGFMFLATAHMNKGEREGALAVLRRMAESPSSSVQKWIFLGEASRWFRKNEAFAPVRDDEDFVELIADKIG